MTSMTEVRDASPLISTVWATNSDMLAKYEKKDGPEGPRVTLQGQWRLAQRPFTASSTVVPKDRCGI